MYKIRVAYLDRIQTLYQNKKGHLITIKDGQPHPYMQFQYKSISLSFVFYLLAFFFTVCFCYFNYFSNTFEFL